MDIVGKNNNDGLRCVGAGTGIDIQGMDGPLQTALGTNGSDVIAELADAAPAATPSLADALMLMYMQLRNELTSTATLMTIKNDAGAGICKATLSDNATTFTKAELVAQT
jgi:hypothetical protein